MEKTQSRQLLITSHDEYTLTTRVNELLATRNWHIATIPTPIGCGSVTKTIERSPVNVEKELTTGWFWAILQQAPQQERESQCKQ